jgi:cyclopropane fatty-acyl-phospholipid synthase-like methyltransferase
MPNPLHSFVARHLGSHIVPRLRQQIAGLAGDFWVDGPQNLLGLDFSLPNFLDAGQAEPAAPRPLRAAPPGGAKGAGPDPNLWHAAPGEISEKMWGDGFVTPGDATINSMLIGPLGLTKELGVLDLSAGLGGRVRHAAETTGAYITGLEPDASIAERGMQLSVRAGKGKHAAITAYDPAKLNLNRSYDCIIARETFYRVPDRPSFFATIARHTKPHAQIAFTDYILNPEHRDHPAVLAWKKFEKLANPAGLVETAEEWGKAGFTLRIHEDMTGFYRAEIKAGMARLMEFLTTGVRPDKETGAALLRRIETWMHRLAAMEAGMKFYRFYGTRR